MTDEKLLAVVKNDLSPFSDVEKLVIELADAIGHVVGGFRLSSLVGCDKILVLERGVLLDFAPHDELVERCEVYRQLWLTQTRHLA